MSNIHCIYLHVAWMDRGSVNVLVLNYHPYVAAKGYPGYFSTVAFDFTPLVKCVAQVLNIFYSYTENFRLIGISLGAQIMGAAARKAKKGKLRLTGTFYEYIKYSLFHKKV